MKETSTTYRKARQDLEAWQQEIQKNCYEIDLDFQHTVSSYLSVKKPELESELSSFGKLVAEKLEPLVIENNLSANLPRMENYNSIGKRVREIIHHPSYEKAGNIIYGSKILQRMSKPGGLCEGLSFMFLSSQAGEAGHNCPVACSAGIIRVLQKFPNTPNKEFYLEKLIDPSYSTNFTGAQFLTEVQGGSDVGQNATKAYQDEQGNWRIEGEKWFCSNADAELILVTARFDEKLEGTKGLALFLVASHLKDGKLNNYALRRLKDKIGTRSMASAEIDFEGALAIPIGELKDGFKIVMENVLHISRLFNTICVLGMARRAYHIALAYAKNRAAFGEKIIKYPLIQENLAKIKAENNALLAFIFDTIRLQDEFDLGKLSGEENKLLLRLLTNLNKYLSALWSVEHIHHSLDVLAGNGAIESFSTISRLLRDCIVCENWEGTHNVLRKQILRDILRYQVDELYLKQIEKKLGTMEVEKKYIQILNKGLTHLKNDLKKLKSSSTEIQSLQIKSIVDQMAILYSAVALLAEAMLQNRDGNPSKLNCLNYFIYMHIEKENAFDERHLSLIKSVINN